MFEPSSLDLSPLPPTLCRFRSYLSPYRNGNDEQGVYDLLTGRLRFSDITSFNDPFEARPKTVLAFPNDPEQQRSAMLRYLAEIAPIEGTSQDKQDWAANALKMRTMDQLLDAADDRAPTGFYFVFCLMHPDAALTPLPWSHYGDDHRGVCVHLDTSMRPVNFSLPVQYGEDYPTVVMPRTERSNDHLLREIVLRKYAGWSYEQEYRIISLRDPDVPMSWHLTVQWNDNVAIAPTDVAREVTLGCRMPLENRTRLTAWLKANAPHVEVWRADLRRDHYGLVRNRVG